jgi:hypothetical protein
MAGMDAPARIRRKKQMPDADTTPKTTVPTTSPSEPQAHPVLADLPRLDGIQYSTTQTQVGKVCVHCQRQHQGQKADSGKSRFQMERSAQGLVEVCRRGLENYAISYDKAPHSAGSLVESDACAGTMQIAGKSYFYKI